MEDVIALVQTLLADDMAERNRLFAGQIRQLKAHLVKENMWSSSVAVTQMQHMAIDEFRVRQGLILQTWQRVLPAIDSGTSFLPQAAQNVAQALSSERGYLEKVITSQPVGGQPNPAGFLDEVCSLATNRLQAELGLLEAKPRQAQSPSSTLNKNNENQPAESTTVSAGLGREYLGRLQGDRSNNLEQAIACFRAALEGITRDEHPKEWANVSGDLGLALALRFRGDKRSNLEQSVNLYLGILEVIDRKAMPEEWARTLVLLGRAYSELEELGTTPEILVGKYARESTPRPQAPVFISYAREDAPAAERLFESLSKSGFQPWLDKECILPGQRWEVAIDSAIRGCRFFLALLSRQSLTKTGYVQKEVRKALEVLQLYPASGVFLVPARLEECQPTDETLRALQWVDLFPDWDRGAERIVLTIRHILTEERQRAGNA